MAYTFIMGPPRHLFVAQHLGRVAMVTFNPFVAVGVNPATHVVTGYVAALLTAPGKTEACKFVFREGNGRLDKASDTVQF